MYTLKYISNVCQRVLPIAKSGQLSSKILSETPNSIIIVPDTIISLLVSAHLGRRSPNFTRVFFKSVEYKVLDNIEISYNIDLAIFCNHYCIQSHNQTVYNMCTI